MLTDVWTFGGREKYGFAPTLKNKLRTKTYMQHSCGVRKQISVEPTQNTFHEENQDTRDFKPARQYVNGVAVKHLADGNPLNPFQSALCTKRRVTFTYVVSSEGPNTKFSIHSYEGYNWISLVHESGASWQLRMYVNLTVRNDTGRMNTSPVTTMTPIVRLKFGCNHTIFIPGMIL